MPDCRSVSATMLPKRSVVIKGPAHHSYLALYSFCQSISAAPRRRALQLPHTNHHRNLATSSHINSSSQFRRSDFTGQPFTGSYDPGEKTSGPLGDASILGAPRLTPRVLKQHLDNFVVGQERAKKVLSVAVYNHYQRVQELLRREEEEHEMLQQQLRREMAESHPLEDEFPGHQQAIPLHSAPPSSEGLGAPPIIDPSPLTLDKSNILLLGPSGVGKTLMAKTLARVLAVPFSMSDCTPFTQAGYIGEDAEICVQRLLAASNYDVAAAERGIICLDEIDKISTTKVANGKDVGGEGVQQALLKIIEGTTLQIQAKSEKSGRGGSGSGGSGGAGGASFNSAYPTNSPLSGSPPSPNASSSTGPSTSGSSGGGGGGGASGKPETYSIRTDNILFIFAGAFIGLDKMIQKRIDKGSIGFNSPIKSSSSSGGPRSPTSYSASSPSSQQQHHLPFFSPHSPTSSPPNPLDLCEPTDLQSYGLIPELTGRIPITTALRPLTLADLARVLTEPRNCLLKQYEMLFSLSGVELRFTRAAVQAVAAAASGMGTGARGLRKVMEAVLEEGMFEAPGSSIKYVLITEAVARREAMPVYLARGQQGKFHSLIAAEEEEWDRRVKAEQEEEEDDDDDDDGGGGGGGSEGKRRRSNEAGKGDGRAGSFEEYRERSRSAGMM